MINDFNSLRGQCDVANGSEYPRFGNSFFVAAVKHYDKHPDFPRVDPNNNLSTERYFSIAREMTSGQSVERPIWTQDGASLSYKFTSAEYGAMAVRFDNLANGTSVIATLMKNNQVTGDPRLYNN